MHTILNSLRYALWLVFCLFRHAVFLPCAFVGVHPQRTDVLTAAQSDDREAKCPDDSKNHPGYVLE